MSSQGSEDLQERAGRPRRHSRRRPPIAIYLVVLFAAAFLLLLMAYFQQQRQSAEATSDALKQSASAVESIQNLMGDNDQLRQENEALKERLNALEEENQRLTRENSDYSNELWANSLAQKALDYFWQIDEAYVRGKYTLCRQLIETAEAITANDIPLMSFLPTESATDNDRFSPADRYQEICDALN